MQYPECYIALKLPHALYNMYSGVRITLQQMLIVRAGCHVTWGRRVLFL